MKKLRNIVVKSLEQSSIHAKTDSVILDKVLDELAEMSYILSSIQQNVLPDDVLINIIQIDTMIHDITKYDMDEEAVLPKLLDKVIELFANVNNTYMYGKKYGIHSFQLLSNSFLNIICLLRTAGKGE